MNDLVSFVVDGSAQQYYQAELLLYSLERFGGVPRNRILVQCVDRVNQEFLDFLRRHGCAWRLIAPFPGDNDCNRLQQLDGIESHLGQADGVYLLDLEMAVVAPFGVPDKQSICGKLMDLPDPPLPVLERIFAAAGLDLPASIGADCDAGRTLVSNLDPGLLFIPVNQVRKISPEWRYWASWLGQRPELFDTGQQRKRLDRIALSLAIASCAQKIALLPANFDFPLHLAIRPASFLPDEPIRIMHYHQLDPFGRIDAADPDAGVVSGPLASFNAALAAQGKSTFFDACKRQQADLNMRVATAARDGVLQQVFSRHKLHEQPRRRLILHAGTPKTGTTSLQHYLYGSRDRLRVHGILYPAIPGEIKDDAVPKHQWLIDCLLSGNEAALATFMDRALDELSADIHTVILSTEGIFNHWWDMPPAAKANLATLADWCSVEVWVWFREPASFMTSYYLQKLCNPRTRQVRSNGIDLSMEEMLQDAWIVRHLDYLGFIRDVQAMFGKESVSVLPYDGDTTGGAMKLLGLDPPPQNEEKRHNVSLGQMGVNLLRTINRHDIDPNQKDQIVALVKQIDALVADQCGPFVLDQAARASIQQRFARQEGILQEEFGLSWAPEPGSRPALPATSQPAKPQPVKSGYKRLF